MVEESELFQHEGSCRGRVQLLIGGQTAFDSCTCILALINEVYTSLPLRGARADLGSFTITYTMKERNT